MSRKPNYKQGIDRESLYIYTINRLHQRLYAVLPKALLLSNVESIDDDLRKQNLLML
ncbi:hypothetical protein BJY00DRAFT_93460 [Aspergillus carlsbadensis]|nr:hypothetical protein BJY00DRAFT_93460 [Aspergillus carlsbadensis]